MTVKPSSRETPSRFAGFFARPLVRGVLVLCGLVVLSLAGRFAVAGGQVSPVASGGIATPPPPIASIENATLPLLASASPSPLPSPSASAPHASHAATDDDPVYLNDATIDDLRRLPGIGEKRALAILELRRKLGRFHQIEDLLRVKGIGRSTLRRLRPLVRIDHAAPDAGAP
jgi:competence protein ComEA